MSKTRSAGWVALFLTPLAFAALPTVAFAEPFVIADKFSLEPPQGWASVDTALFAETIQKNLKTLSPATRKLAKNADSPLAVFLAPDGGGPFRNNLNIREMKGSQGVDEKTAAE